MLARTAATHASSELFAGEPADNSPSPLIAPDQDEGYFDMIMRVPRHRPPERCRSRKLYPRVAMMQS